MNLGEALSLDHIFAYATERRTLVQLWIIGDVYKIPGEASQFDALLKLRPELLRQGSQLMRFYWH